MKRSIRSVFLFLAAVVSIASFYLFAIWSEKRSSPKVQSASIESVDRQDIASGSKDEAFGSKKGQSLRNDQAGGQDSQVSDAEDSSQAGLFSLSAMMQKQYDGRDLSMGPVLEKNNAYTRYYVTYLSGDLKISGIMNVPNGEGPFPVLVLNHGYINPAEYVSGGGMQREQNYLARQGYVVLQPDYRNYADSDRDPGNEMTLGLGYIEDVINAVYAVKSSDFTFLDKQNIGMLGHSMGGGIAINVMVVQPELVKAVGLFAPISADQQDNLAEFTKHSPDMYDLIIKIIGAPDQNPAFWDSISASSYFSNVKAPVQLHHGTADKTVPFAWSEKLDGKLREQGKQVEFHAYQGEDHDFFAAWPTVMQRTVEFMDRYLKQ